MHCPAVKRVHCPVVLPGRRIRLGMEQYGVASEIVDDDAGSVERLLTLLDGSRDVPAVCEGMRATHPTWTPDDVRAVIRQLAEAGHLEDLAAELPRGLTAEHAVRYRSARDFFAWIDTEPRPSPLTVQARIGSARVVLLGLGGTGSSVAASLVASGIGGLRCVDFDVVEEGNLTRQLLYTEADVGRSKVAVAVERLRALNSLVEVTGTELCVRSEDDVAALMAAADVLVLCADEPADVIQHWVSRAALRTSTPWFLASYTGAMTGVGSFVPGETGCWECLQRSRPYDDADGRWLFDDKPHAVVAASAAIAGHLCALDVLYRLGGLPSQTRGKVFQLNLAQWDHQYALEVRPDPGCPACGESAR